ncbi:MAG: hypothetical protein ACKVTZ_06485, partial [Bacteroidia bacterium]
MFFTQSLNLMHHLFRGGGNIQNPNVYDGYVLKAAYSQEVDVTLEDSDPNDNNSTAKTMVQTVYFAQNFALQDDGKVSFSLPDLLPTTPIFLSLQAPDGTEIWELEIAFSALDTNITALWVANPLLYGALGIDPNAQSEMKRLRGKAVDLTGAEKVANRQVIIWGKFVGSTIWQAVMICTTDADGNFFGDYPLGKFDEGAATVSGTNAETEANALPISLETHPVDATAKAFPHFVLLVLSEVNACEDDCDCNGVKVPRCPDTTDLHDNASVYSQDIGGACTNFTVPNRSLEEFTYYM